jgi:hypothetical protein
MGNHYEELPSLSFGSDVWSFNFKQGFFVAKRFLANYFVRFPFASVLTATVH